MNAAHSKQSAEHREVHGQPDFCFKHHAVKLLANETCCPIGCPTEQYGGTHYGKGDMLVKGISSGIKQSYEELDMENKKLRADVKRLKALKDENKNLKRKLYKKAEASAVDGFAEFMKEYADVEDTNTDKE
jgi:hypothetical protein